MSSGIKDTSSKLSFKLLNLQEQDSSNNDKSNSVEEKLGFLRLCIFLSFPSRSPFFFFFFPLFISIECLGGQAITETPTDWNP